MKYDHYLVIAPESVVHRHFHVAYRLHVVHGWHLLLHIRLHASLVVYAFESRKWFTLILLPHKRRDAPFLGVDLPGLKCLLRFLVGAILQRANITNETKSSPEIGVSIH